MNPWAWTVLFVLAALGVWALGTVAELKNPLIEPDCFLGGCGLVYLEETWDEWMDRWRDWWGI